MPKLMSSKTRTLAGVATAVASLAVGVFGARAIDPAESGSPATAGAQDATVLVDGVATPAGEVGEIVDVEVPIVAPVFVGDDPATIGRLLAGPPAAQDRAGQSYDGTGSEIIGSITQQMVFAQSGDGADGADDADQLQVLSLPNVFDSIAERFLPFPTHAFDICAGRRPGSHVSVPRAFGSRSGCPVGFAGTIRGLFTWPAPFIRGEVNHHLAPSDGISQTCPADTPRAGDNQTAVTAFSSVPLVSLRAEWRQYPTLRAWNSIDVAGTSAAHAEHWAAERAAGIFTNDAMLPHCFVIDTDWNRSYEVRITGTDADGNTYESNQFIVSSRTIGRPPTHVVSIDLAQLHASVQSYTVEGGSVDYRIRSMANDDDTSCSAAGEGVFDVRYTDISPVEAPSESYPRLADGWIPLTVGSNLLCATILDAEGIPIGVDVVVIRTPSLQRPVITLAGVRLNSGVTIPGAATSEYGVGELGVFALFDGSFAGPCSTPWWNSDDLTGATPEGDIALLFDCGSGEGVTDEITVATSRRWSADVVHRTYRSIPVAVDVCDPTCPHRPAEWYEIPIASSGGERCGEVGTEFTAECTVTDGVAILRVDYNAIAGAPGATGTYTLLSSDVPTDRSPVLRIIDSRIDSFADWGAIPLALTIESDVAVDLVGVTPTTTAAPEAGCPPTATFEPSRGTVFDVVLTVCAGSLNGLTVEVVDELGFGHEIPLSVAGEVQPFEIRADAVHTTIEVLGSADGLGFAEVDFLRAELSGVSSAIWGYEWSGTAGSTPGCISLDDAVFQSDIDPFMQLQPYAGAALELELDITAAGVDDCDAGGGVSSGVDVGGFVSVTELQSGEPIVFTSRPGAALQVRVTVTADWYLTRDGVRVGE